MTMNFSKQLLPKTLWLGAFGLAAILLGSPSSSKAQEVSPAHFTATGVEDAYPVTKPSPKKTSKVQIATNLAPVSADAKTGRAQKARKVVRKQTEVSSASL